MAGLHRTNICMVIQIWNSFLVHKYEDAKIELGEVNFVVARKSKGKMLF